MCRYCGSSEYDEKWQLDCYDVTDPRLPRDQLRFTTRAERVANPNLKVADWQRCLYCPDPDWLVCVRCEGEIPRADVDAAYRRFYHNHPAAFVRAHTPVLEQRIFMRIGMAIGNTAALARVDFN